MKSQQKVDPIGGKNNDCMCENKGASRKISPFFSRHVQCSSIVPTSKQINLATNAYKNALEASKKTFLEPMVFDISRQEGIGMARAQNSLLRLLAYGRAYLISVGAMFHSPDSDFSKLDSKLQACFNAIILNNEAIESGYLHIESVQREICIRFSQLNNSKLSAKKILSFRKFLTDHFCSLVSSFGKIVLAEFKSAIGKKQVGKEHDVLISVAQTLEELGRLLMVMASECLGNKKQCANCPVKAGFERNK